MSCTTTATTSPPSSMQAGSAPLRFLALLASWSLLVNSAVLAHDELFSDSRAATHLQQHSRHKRIDFRTVEFPNNTYIDRTSFPPDFIFGTLTMAIKHEGFGSVDQSQKTDSIWDAYAASPSSTVLDGTQPKNAGDQYDRYKEDMELVEEMGMDAFRFSIAWTRIFPNGTGVHITPNSEAIAHYNALIDLLLEKGIEPHVTLWAEDHPHALEDEYGGLLSSRFIDDFVVFANVCFAEFGDRVKYWVTQDEPNDYVALAYASTQSPPGRCSCPGYYMHGNCTVGNSTTEPYLVAHNMLLAHAAVARLYKQKYQEEQGGMIGIALWFKWYEPMDSTNSSDVAAAQRAQDWYFGWFMDPLAFGEYPESMRTILGPRLPSFTPEEADMVRGSFDFVGLNAVTAMYAQDTSYQYQDTALGYYEDARVNLTGYDNDGVSIGEGTLERSVPWCLTRIVAYMRERYGNPPMYVTETGWGIASTPFFEDNLNDTERVQYFHSYYASLSEAIRDGGDVRGVFAWSLIDGFELFLGLCTRFGLVYVDENMERYPRLSAYWHQMVLSNNYTRLLTTQSSHTPSLAFM
eukprot:c16099_g1_i1 orf=123-1847(-)